MAEPWNELREQARSLLSLADRLEAEAKEAREPDDRMLCLRDLRELFGFSRESLRSASESGLPVVRGPRGKLMASRRDVESWIRSRRWQPNSARRATTDFEDHDAACLRALGGGK